jgi:PKD repeat protein
VHKQETPPLTGPSELGTAIVVTVSPDVLVQDGASQSLVQITARDNNGQPLRNRSLRVDIAVDGFITDFGRLSAKSVVTDSNGRASVTYTAPPPVFGITSTVNVQILVTPSETDFGNSLMRFVTIRITPAGVIGPPTSPFIPNFTPPSTTVGNPATFTATVTGTSPNASVVAFVWDFGDGDTAVGPTVQHTFDDIGVFLVTLGLVDSLGRTNFVTKSVTVGPGTPPTVVEIFASPTFPAVGQVINFSASTTVEPGHRIVGYDWNFGDGTFAGGSNVQHAYQAAGEYTVTVQVTDDADRVSTLKSLKIVVGGSGGGSPTASLTISPTNPTAGAPVFFDGSASTGSSGSAIISYSWTFSPTGGSATGQTVTRTFTAGAYQVTLTVTDSQGKTATQTRPFTVS